MWSKCSHQPYGENIFRMLLGKFQMTTNCYGGSNVVYMLMLHSKCCINVPIGSRLNTWSGYIWNVPNLLLVGKWRVPSTRAYNVLKMFLLVSRPPHPQCLYQGTGGLYRDILGRGRGGYADEWSSSAWECFSASSSDSCDPWLHSFCCEYWPMLRSSQGSPPEGLSSLQRSCRTMSLWTWWLVSRASLFQSDSTYLLQDPRTWFVEWRLKVWEILLWYWQGTLRSARVFMWWTHSYSYSMSRKSRILNCGSRWGQQKRSQHRIEWVTKRWTVSGDQ